MLSLGRVEMTWRPDIVPVVIEGPPIPTPPDVLAHLHFGDNVLYVLAGTDPPQE
jgi:hypothetical protein